MTTKGTRSVTRRAKHPNNRKPKRVRRGPNRYSDWDPKRGWVDKGPEPVLSIDFEDGKPTTVTHDWEPAKKAQRPSTKMTDAEFDRALRAWGWE